MVVFTMRMPGLMEPPQGVLRRLGEVRKERARVRRIGHGDRGHRVFEDVDTLASLRSRRRIASRRSSIELFTQWLEACPAMISRSSPSRRSSRAPFRLASDDAVVGEKDLGREDRVVLGERVHALDFDAVARATRVRMEQTRFLDDAGEDMAIAAEEHVGRPEVQDVLARLRE